MTTIDAARAAFHVFGLLIAPSLVLVALVALTALVARVLDRLRR